MYSNVIKYSSKYIKKKKYYKKLKMLVLASAEIKCY